MFDTQKALVGHLNKIKADFDIKTVKGYTGEFREVHKLTDLKPAVFVTFIGGNKTFTFDQFRFDLLVLTDSKVFDRKANMEANLQLSQDIMDWILDNNNLPYNGRHYHIVVDRDEQGPPPSADTLLISEKFTVVAIHLTVDKK